MKRFLFVIMGLLVTACDPVYRAEVKNETGTDIFLSVEFDRKALERGWNGRPYIAFLESYPNDGLVDPPVSFDTVNLIKTYRIGPNSTFPLETGIGQHPDFEIFQALKIVGTDTSTYLGRDEISAAFKNTDVRYWVLSVNGK